jgi:hypothetical protein
VQRFHQQHAVQPVHEIDRLLQAEVILQYHVHRAGAAKDEGEAEHPHQRRRNDRQQREKRKRIAVREVVADQQERHRYTDDGGGEDRPHTQQHRFPERAQVERILKKILEIQQRELPGLGGECIIENPRQRIHQKDRQKHPDQAVADGGQQGGALAGNLR